jgi:hypothetical protein
MMFFAIDRSPGTDKPTITAFTVREACTGYVASDRDHRHKLTKAEAARLVKLYHGVKLDEALARGLV